MLSSWKSKKKSFKPLTKEEIKSSLSNKDILVIGGTKGIGAALVRELGTTGNAKVTFTGRACTDKSLLEIPEAKFISCDLSTVGLAREFVRDKLEGKQFDTVIFCLGIVNKPKIVRNVEGIEEDMATSYLSRFVILTELIRANSMTGRKRVYNFGYPGNHNGPYNLDDINFDKTETKYKQLQAHINPVLFNDALVYEVKRRYPELETFGVNPGLVHRSAHRHQEEEDGPSPSFANWLLDSMIGLFHISTEEYVEKVGIHLIAKPESHSPCSFLHNGEEQSPLGWISDEKNRIKCWELSEELVERATRNANIGRTN
jgi:hypothetical protein